MDKHSLISRYRPDLAPFETIYRDVHENPELSGQEVRTASIVASFLDSLGGFRVHRNVGGHGVVAVLENGPGRTVMLRADMDALPHLERTGLPYPSKETATDAEGRLTPVMHACGHDMHTACLLGTTKLLHTAREHREGTLICLFQPAEEIAQGARAMVADGLYTKVPVPDIVLGQHLHAFKAGVVALGGGPILTAVDSYEIRIFGKSGHISRPDVCVDPIITASHIVVRLQSIVTKEVQPEDFAVVVCASIHGGSTANIFPDYVDIKLSIRSYRLEVHTRLVEAVKRVVRAESEISGSSSVHEPTFKLIMQMPPTVNDMARTEILKKAFKAYFGDNARDKDPFGASEDFSILATACGAPYVFYMIGCVDADRWDEAERKGETDQIPHNHSAFFAPVIQPTMKTGVDAFSLAALTFLEYPTSEI